MHDQRIASANKAHQCLKLRPLRVLARGFVGEGFSDLDAFQLASCILLKSADPYVPNALSKRTCPSYMSS
jgi:hypothetical protein